MTKRLNPKIDLRSGTKGKRKRRTREELLSDPFFRDQSGGNRRRRNAQGKTKEELGIDMRFTIDPQDRKFRKADEKERKFRKLSLTEFGSVHLTGKQVSERFSARSRSDSNQLRNKRSAGKKLEDKFARLTANKRVIKAGDFSDKETDAFLEIMAKKRAREKELDIFMGRKKA